MCRITATWIQVGWEPLWADGKGTRWSSTSQTSRSDLLGPRSVRIALRIVERFTRVDYNTIDDGAGSGRFQSADQALHDYEQTMLRPGTVLQEYVCEDNEDPAHFDALEKKGLMTRLQGIVSRDHALQSRHRARDPRARPLETSLRALLATLQCSSADDARCRHSRDGRSTHCREARIDSRDPVVRRRVP